MACLKQATGKCRKFIINAKTLIILVDTNAEIITYLFIKS